MKCFSGYEYLLIDVAGQYGLDKLLFEERIQWATDHLHELEDLTEEAENKPLYQKAVMAIRDAQAGKAIGHRVGLDAICSGLQIMSVLTGCASGARATGLVDPNTRADAYTVVTDTMNQILRQHGISVDVSRSDAKEATMTVLYGSRAQPKKIFGEDTPELSAFYQAVQQVAPGAWELLQELLGSWQPFALMHRWVLPDGFVARVKVMEDMEARIEVDELDHAQFTYRWKENQGSLKGLSNVANVIHSIDAYVLRSLIRRCSYEPYVVQRALHYCTTEIMERDLAGLAQDTDLSRAPEAIQKYVERFHATNMVDAVILPHLNHDTVIYLSDDHLRRLNLLMEEMLNHKPFPIVSVHDEFSAHVNNLNVLRQQYINILAEMADSTILDDIFSTITGTPGTYTKVSTNLSNQIRDSEYAIC